MRVQTRLKLEWYLRNFRLLIHILQLLITSVSDKPDWEEITLQSADYQKRRKMSYK
jgi:hypothetical protein